MVFGRHSNEPFSLPSPPRHPFIYLSVSLDLCAALFYGFYLVRLLVNCKYSFQLVVSFEHLTVNVRPGWLLVKGFGANCCWWSQCWQCLSNAQQHSDMAMHYVRLHFLSNLGQNQETNTSPSIGRNDKWFLGQQEDGKVYTQVTCNPADRRFWEVITEQIYWW